ncbi:MAG: indolepyruvate ferredoxin oxidoreductase subunit alpha [Candidatus Bipolaricaulia bacterium]
MTSTAKTAEKLLSGNAAIARGVWEGGVHVAAAYPGTPSTEILEELARYENINCEWSTNEKVALEVAVGASVAGGRALAAMKHVGVNVAADPLFSASYMGANGGLVIVSADDPGMHSSQNEQDNRRLARAARLALLEPSTPQEAKDHARRAFELSERCDTPVMLRTTTRISHGTGPVERGERHGVERKPYRKRPQKHVVLPAHGRIRHNWIEAERIPQMEAEAERWVKVFEGSGDLAIVTAGSAFPYVREAFPDAAVLKLGLTHPLPRHVVTEFCEGRSTILVAEELEPFLEEQVRALGIECLGKDVVPRTGELSVDALRAAVADSTEGRPQIDVPPLPPRPPVLCPGCGHRGVFTALDELGATVTGDIGCYTLGALPPLGAMDTCMNMGASIGMAHGMAKVMAEAERENLVAVIGDSTFYHSGIPGLVDVLYNGGMSTVVVMDNHTTAMTGHQGHPGMGKDVHGEPARVVDLEGLCRGLGIEHVARVDPYDLDAVRDTLEDALDRDQLSVVIADAPCVLMERTQFDEPLTINRELCTDCHACTTVGCPGIGIDENGTLQIDGMLCIACTHCQQVCSDCHAGADIPRVLELVNEGRDTDALATILDVNPFPAVSGRVCPHPCEHETNALGWPQGSQRAERFPELVRAFPLTADGRRLSVQAVERHLGDVGLEEYTGAEFAPPADRPEHVAIVGSGPAGLAAAWHLRRAGVGVTVFESSGEPGGMMREGIPDFRLDKAVLDGEIARLTAIGVEIRCGIRIGRDRSFEDLKADSDAVVLGVGLDQPREIQLEGMEPTVRGWWDGLELLRRANGGEALELGPHVVVIGGGNTAVDCARTARRHGAEVTVCYRRTEAEMPAIADEVDEASAEGVAFQFLVAPERLRTVDGQATGLELRPMKLGEPDQDERRRPEPIDGATIEISADTVIMAIGERADLSWLADSQLRDGNRIPIDFTGSTPEQNVFACGDAAFGHGTVTQGIATGRRVADSVVRFLNRRRSP